MSEVEDIRQKKLQQMQQFMQMEMLAKQKLTKDALARYGNIKAAHPELTQKVVAILLQTDHSSITDDQFKKLLQLLQPQKREFKFKRV